MTDIALLMAWTGILKLGISELDPRSEAAFAQHTDS